MHPIFVYSSKVSGSKEIGEALEEIGIATIDTMASNILEIDQHLSLNEDELKKGVAVLSPHKSKEGIKSLTCHTPGNWGAAMFGGKERTLNISMPTFMTSLLNQMKRNGKDRDDVQICFEVDHHGPTTSYPICFVEIGSCEKEWKDKDLANIIAKSISEVVDSDIKMEKVCVGFGGGHYTPKFTKMAGKNYAFGHMMAKYNQDDLTKEIFTSSIEKNTEKIEYVVIDKKGIKKEARDKLEEWSRELGLEVVRV